MPPRARDLVKAVADPLVRTAVGDGRRRALVDDALARLAPRRSRRVDLTGWTTPELLAHLAEPASGRPRPPRRRVGADTVAQVNAVSGLLPTEAVPLARSITDCAPPLGVPAGPTLRAVLESYLPQSLRAFEASRARGPNPEAEALLMAQLALLLQVAQDVRRAEADDNDLALRVQDGFLRERFAALRPSELTLDPARWSPRPWPEADEPSRPATGPGGGGSGGQVPRSNASARVDADPVVVFPTGRAGARRISFRLAVPKGYPATVGAVVESRHAAVSFRHAETRRWFAARRRTGFPSAQTDLTLATDVAGLRRLLVYAASPARAEPLGSVVFVRDDRGAQTGMPTVLANRAGAAYTVVCSGYAIADGLVLRNESTLYPDLRSACVGFGYRDITWLDPDTPIV
ncbi:MAG: hypothetical protein V9F82_02175 [Dermatophilaceae bacterium]